MFPTFTGTSRKPRQVNLSGQVADPFAAWGSTASGTKNAVANAQRERQQRQAERDRVNAAKLFQRLWRGQRTRRLILAQRRAEWDSLYLSNHPTSVQHGSNTSILNLPLEIRLLSVFFTHTSLEDIKRLARLSEQLLNVPEVFQPNVPSVSNLLLRTLNMAFASFENAEYRRLRDARRDNILRLMLRISSEYPEALRHNTLAYYRSLSRLTGTNMTAAAGYDEWLGAIKGPLGWSTGTKHSPELLQEAREDFILIFLTGEVNQDLLKELFVGPRLRLNDLCRILVLDSITKIERLSHDRQIWLLANFILIQHLQSSEPVSMYYVALLSHLLSANVGHLAGKLDSEESQSSEDSENEDYPNTAVQLPILVKELLLMLVRKDSISSIITLFTRDTSSAAGIIHRNLCKLFLMLFKVFPHRSEEIHMWLYQSSYYDPITTKQQPIVKLLWHLAKERSAIREVVVQQRSGLELLNERSHNSSASDAWQITILFLEIYAFALRFMDDEEFLSSRSSDILASQNLSSRSRDSALAIEDVKLLTVFLKEIAFTMFYNVKDLHIGSSGARGDIIERENTSRKGASLEDADQSFFYKSGLTFHYVRGIITRVMRMIYERDSRRQFLPKNHWLMTSRFDMENLIANVVDEEERRTEIEEAGEDETEDDVPIPSSMVSRRTMYRGQMRTIEPYNDHQRPENRRRNLLAAIGPKVEILQNMPFVIPFETRVQVFREFVRRDQLRRRGGITDPDQWRMMQQMNTPMRGHAKHHGRIRRDQLLLDSMLHFYSLGEGLKEPIQITFVDQFGAIEAGIDGGGVTKEFLTSIVRDGFYEQSSDHPSMPRHFASNEQNLIYPNPTALDEFRGILDMDKHESQAHEDHTTMSGWLDRFEFLGRIIGKCLYEGILVDTIFAGFFLLKWPTPSSASNTHSNGLVNINDLRDLDESLYRGLLQLKTFQGDVKEVFDLDFTITDSGWQGVTIERELLPNGKNVPVTNENRIQYISLVANHRLNRQPYLITRQFLRGLHAIIAPRWLSMFNQTELQTLVGGDSSEIDVEDLRRNTIYGGLYQIGDDGLEHPTVVLFWEALKLMDDADRRKLLHYVTSTPRAPLLGFSVLNPRFSIRDAGSDQQRLPSTSTCVNLLKLPKYDNLDTMRQKLTYAINSNAGFDLS